MTALMIVYKSTSDYSYHNLLMAPLTIIFYDAIIHYFDFIFFINIVIAIYVINNIIDTINIIILYY